MVMENENLFQKKGVGEQIHIPEILDKDISDIRLLMESVKIFGSAGSLDSELLDKFGARLASDFESFFAESSARQGGISKTRMLFRLANFCRQLPVKNEYRMAFLEEMEMILKRIAAKSKIVIDLGLNSEIELSRRKNSSGSLPSEKLFQRPESTDPK